MKSTKRNVKFAAFFCLLILFSCNKSSTDPLPSMPGNTKSTVFNSTNSETDYYKNPSNSFDFIGEFHNLGCDLLLDQITTIGKDSLYLELENKAINFESSFFSSSLQDCVIRLDSAKIRLEQKSDANNGNVFLILQSSVDDWNSSLQCKNYAYNIITLLFDNKNTNDSVGFHLIINEIKSKEAQILSDNLLTIEEQATLLKVTSIVRHSIHYWTTNDPPTITNVAWPKWTEKLFGWVKRNEGPIVTVASDILTALSLGVTTSNPLGEKVTLGGAVVVSVIAAVVQ